MDNRRTKHRKYQAALISAALIVAAMIAWPSLCAKAEAKKAKSKTAAASSATSSGAGVATPEATAPRPDSPPPMAADDRLPFMAGDERSPSAEQPSNLGMLARTLGALLLVIGLLVGVTWCLKRIKGSPFGGSREDDLLAVLKTVALGDRRSLTVARFGEKILLIGSTPQSFTLLACDDPESLLPVTAEELMGRSVAEVLSASEEDQEASFASEFDRLGEWR